MEQPVVRETAQRPGWLLVLSGSLVVTCSVVLWLVCGSIRRLMVVELTSCGGDKGGFCSLCLLPMRDTFSHFSFSGLPCNKGTRQCCVGVMTGGGWVRLSRPAAYMG